MQIIIYHSRFSLLSCSGKNVKIPWKSQRKLREFSQNVEVSQNMATLNQDGVPASPLYQRKPCLLRFFLCCVKTVRCRKMKLSDLVSSMGQCFLYGLISLWRFAQYDHQSLRTEMKLSQSNCILKIVTATPWQRLTDCL